MRWVLQNAEKAGGERPGFHGGGCSTEGARGFTGATKEKGARGRGRDGPIMRSK